MDSETKLQDNAIVNYGDFQRNHKPRPACMDKFMSQSHTDRYCSSNELQRQFDRLPRPY